MICISIMAIFFCCKEVNFYLIRTQSLHILRCINPLRSFALHRKRKRINIQIFLTFGKQHFRFSSEEKEYRIFINLTLMETKKITSHLFYRIMLRQTKRVTEQILWTSSVWWRIRFLKHFLLFLAPAEALTLQGQFSNPAWQSFTFIQHNLTLSNLSKATVKMRRNQIRHQTDEFRYFFYENTQNDILTN